MTGPSAGPSRCAVSACDDLELAARTQADFEKQVTELLKADRKAGIAFITNRTWELADAYREAIWQAVDFLMWKYDMGFVTENGKVSGKGYPAEWIDKLFKYNFGTSDIRGWSQYVAPAK